MDAWQIPGPWPAVILTLGAARVVRFLGWDTFPLVARVRARVVGEYWVPGDPDTVELPGKQPTSDATDVRVAYRRPTVAHLIACPFCLSVYVAVMVYLAWVWQPGWTLAVLFPAMVSGVVGWISKNLDA